MPLLRSLARRLRAAVLSFALDAAAPQEIVAAAREIRRTATLRGVKIPRDAERFEGGATEPSERSYTAWTPARLKWTQAQAEIGNLREAADLCTAILADDRMSAVLGTRVRSLLGLPLTFEKGQGRKKTRAARAAEADEDWWAIFSEAEEFRLLLWALLLGAGLGQLLYYETVDGKRVVRYRNGRIVPRLRTWNPRYLRWDPDTREWKLRIKGNKEITIAPGDGEWILLLPYGDVTPAMWGLWRALARLWLLKSCSVDDWANTSETHGQPFKWVQPPDQTMGTMAGTAPASTPDERRAIALEVDALIAGGTIASPPGYKLSLIEAKANTWQIFRGQIDFVDTAAAITVNGVNLTTEVKGGSYAAAMAQTLVRDDLRRFDAEVESSELREQGLKPWSALNFGDPEAAPWPKRETALPENREALAKTWKAGAEAVKTLQGTGYRIPLDELEERLGMKLEPDEADDPEGDEAPQNEAA